MSLFRIRPEFVARPWGRRSLEPLFAMPAGEARPIGEVWLTSIECLVEGAGAAPVKLGSFWRDMTSDRRGSAVAGAKRFPLLVKFLFTGDKLSVQVHPDDEYARREAGEPWGKTEAWHILAAEPDAWVHIGFKKGAAAKAVEAAWGKPEMEPLLNRGRLKAGQTFLIPAGTVHSVGPGLCLCEVQQYSDLTYRIYDYDRPGLDGKPRMLQLEEAREVAKIKTPAAGLVAPAKAGQDDGEVSLVESPYFRMDKCAGAGPLKESARREAFTLFVVTRGRGMLQQGGAKFRYERGNAFLLTAGDERADWTREEATEFLRIRPVRAG